MNNDINSYLLSVKSRVDLYIEQYYSAERENIPTTLYNAINYAVFPGGKMLRPAIVFAICEELGRDPQITLPIASAIELIHTFSLIHDDLPCMDNDDFRRGRESLHKKYSEAIGLLTGDALLTDAFGIVARSEGLTDSIKCRLIQLISRYVGSSGMIGGQILDIEPKRSSSYLDYYRLIRLKTANMFILSSLVGAVCSGVDFSESHIINFGENFGTIFQLTDDILDYQQDKKGSFNIIEKEGFASIFKKIDEYHKQILYLIDNLHFNQGIIRGITEFVIKRIEHIRDAEEA